MAVDLFAGIPVGDYNAALAWYERLLGRPPTYVAGEFEVVWELAEHRSLAVERLPERAGNAVTTVFIDDLDAFVAAAVERGVEPVKQETYDNGVRKATFRDPEGNEIGFGGAPL